MRMNVMNDQLNWMELGELADIPQKGSRILKRASGDIAIFRTEDDHIFALDNKCPHKGGPLADGIVHGHKIACPLHNWVMEMETGIAVAPDEGQVKTWPVKLEDETIFISID